MNLAYWTYFVSMLFYKLLHLIKWAYYLVGTGKDDFRPWEVRIITTEFFTEQQRQVLLEIANNHLAQLRTHSLLSSDPT